MNVIQCDNCGKLAAPAGDEAEQWIHITWGYGTKADFCDAACAVVGIRHEQEQETLLSKAVSR